MPEDRWRDAAAYDRYMGRWSRLLALDFLSWLDLPPGSGWLEIGCGTGALTRAICEAASPRSVTACDTAADYVAFCRERLRHPSLTVVAAGTDALPTRPGGYDAVVSSLVLNFLPDPVAALARMRDLCAPGGCVAACVWDYAVGMEFLRIFWDVAVELDPDAGPLHEGTRFPLCRPEALRAAFAAAGLGSVEVVPLTIPTRFVGFEDFWAPFADGPGPAPSYVAALDERRRRRLAERLRSRLGAAGGRPITLEARAWAARGHRPAA